MVKNKKGSARDIVLIAAILFAVGIGLFSAHYMINQAVNTMTNNTVVNSSQKAVTVLNNTGDLTNRLDYVIFGLFMGLILFLIVSSWFIGGNMLFAFLYICFIVISVIISVILSNTWESVTQSAVFGTTITLFPLTNNIMLNLPLYISVIGVIGMFVMFAKPYLSQQ